MKREFKVESLETGEPKVNYRETITEKTPFDYLHKRQTGGRGQYGKIIGYVEPIPVEERKENEDGIEFVNVTSGQELPPNYIPAIEKGFRQSTTLGLLAGNPLIYTRVVLEAGQAHEVDSSAEAFQAAAAGAYEQAYQDASPCILEPIMQVEVTFPTEFQAATLQTLNGREGSIQNTRAMSEDTTLVEAVVPLRRMFGYMGELRSVTQGQGEFSMEFREYEQMTAQKQEEFVADYKKRRYEERRA
jgi:elongation factor G